MDLSPRIFCCQLQTSSPVATRQIFRLPSPSPPSVGAIFSHVSRNVPLGESQSSCTCGRGSERATAPLPSARSTRTPSASTAPSTEPSALKRARWLIGAHLRCGSSAAFDVAETWTILPAGDGPLLLRTNTLTDALAPASEMSTLMVCAAFFSRRLCCLRAAGLARTSTSRIRGRRFMLWSSTPPFRISFLQSTSARTRWDLRSCIRSPTW
jgi:hypothetical protein